MDKHFDVVIVGGGSAGAVLANRLSADPTRKVLLLEGGKAYAPDSYPEVLRRQDSVGGDADHDWGYHSEAGVIGRSIPLNRGKVLGGSSAINGAVAMRAPKADHERWALQFGLDDLSWEQAQPFYASLEMTSGRGGAGRNGPFPIHQLGEEEVSDQHRALIASARAAGYASTAGFATADPLGVGPYVMNTRMGVRLNTGVTLLSQPVRDRANLTIQDQVLVDCILVRGGRAVGVQLADGATIQGGEIILSCGTYGSPALLMRSGIGPSDALDRLSIPVVANLPIGRKLQDHPFLPTVWTVRRDANALGFPPIGAMLLCRSRSAEEGADLHISTAVLPDDPASDEAKFLLFAALVRPKSLGSFTLASRDPRAAPKIDLGFLSDPNDRERLIDGMEIIRRIAACEPFASMVGGELQPGAAVKSRSAIESTLAASIGTYQHPTSTVPMGGINDPHAVVDSHGRVRDIKNLRVIDASIWPDVPSVATGFPTMMLAERIASTM